MPKHPKFKNISIDMDANAAMSLCRASALSNLQMPRRDFVGRMDPRHAPKVKKLLDHVIPQANALKALMVG